MSSSLKDEVHAPISWRERWRTYRYFMAFAWKASPGLACLRALIVTVNALSAPAEVYIFSLLITAITVPGGAEKIPFLIVAVIVAHGLQTVSQYVLNSYLEGWFSRTVSTAAQFEVFSHLTRIDPEALIQKEVRRDVDIVREELWRLHNISSATESWLRAFIGLIGAGVLAFTAPWWVSLLVFGYAILEAIVFGFEAKKDIWTAIWNSLDGRRVEYSRHVFLSGDEFREVRLLGAGDRFLKRLDDSAQRILHRFRSVALQSTASRTALSIAHIAIYGTLLVVFGRRAMSHPETLGTLYVALNLFSLLGDSCSRLSSASAKLFSHLQVLAPLRHLLSVPEESTSGLAIPRELLVIQFDHVSYRYLGAKKDALRDVSLTLREGEHIAVVGENGAGKSTFLRLLSGLDRPTKGKILVNGKPLDAYLKREWRQAFHLLLQGAMLYQDFVRDNLLYGEPPRKWKSAALPMNDAVKIAGADALIRELPYGEKTFLGDWAAPPGVTAHKVSGGQSQRLLIARSLIHGGRFIGFDEPTSAIDAVAETAFFERLHESLRHKSLIFISHRFSTVRRASRILVFHEGRLQQDGPHDELLHQDGRYAELYREQAKWYR